MLMGPLHLRILYFHKIDCKALLQVLNVLIKFKSLNFMPSRASILYAFVRKQEEKEKRERNIHICLDL